MTGLTAIAKLAVLWVDRAENINGNYAISDKPLSEQEWETIAGRTKGSGYQRARRPSRHWGSARVGRRGLRRRSRLGVAESTRGSAIALDPAAPRSCYVALS
jgi:hypothetical protein